MPTTLAPWERVPESVRPALQEYVDKLCELGGPNVRSVTLFGAVAYGTFDPLRHTVSNVVVLERMDLDFLRRFSEYGPHFGAAGIAAPLVMTPAYLDASRDTFPLELIEIHQNHVTLFGEDAFEDLTFEDSDVRLQVERELKVALIRLRQGLLAAAGRERDLDILVRDVSADIVRTLRGLLWLEGQREAKPAREVITAVEVVTKRQLGGLRLLTDPHAARGWSAFEGLYRDIEALGEVADAL